ncbi:unnamed protein product [Camellia sinensis]
MDAIDELAQLADSMRQASALLPDEDVDENSSSLHRPSTFLNVVALGNTIYLNSLILLCKLMTKVDLLPPSVKDLQFNRFFKNGFLLLARVIAVTFCVALATSLAARLGATPMAAFQICLQVWMTLSLLSDGMAIAGQTMLSLLVRLLRRIMRKQNLLQPECCRWHLGLRLTVVVGLRLQFGSGIFTKDKNVVHLISIGIPVLVSVVSIASLFLLWKSQGFVGIWCGLTIFMGLRAFSGILSEYNSKLLQSTNYITKREAVKLG